MKTLLWTVHEPDARTERSGVQLGRRMASVLQTLTTCVSIVHNHVRPLLVWGIASICLHGKAMLQNTTPNSMQPGEFHHLGKKLTSDNLHLLIARKYGTVLRCSLVILTPSQ